MTTETVNVEYKITYSRVLKTSVGGATLNVELDKIVEISHANLLTKATKTLQSTSTNKYDSLSASGAIKIAKVSASTSSSTAITNEIASLLSQSVEDRNSIRARESRTVNFYFPVDIGGSVYQAHVIGPGIRYATFSWVQTKIDEPQPPDEIIQLDVDIEVEKNDKNNAYLHDVQEAKQRESAIHMNRLVRELQYPTAFAKSETEQLMNKLYSSLTYS